MKKNDVLMLCQFFYPEVITSAQLPFQTAKYIAKNGISVDVFCGFPKEYLDNEKVLDNETIEGININRIKYLQLNRGNVITRLINYFSFVFAMFLKIPQMRKYKIIMVYSNPPILPLIAVIANKLFRAEIIFIAYDIYPEMAIYTDAISKQGMISRTMKFINEKLYPLANVVALSDDMKHFLIKNRKIDSDNIHVIHNWAMEEENVSQDNNLGSLSEKSEEFIITYLGNMGIAQDFETLLEAFKIIESRDENIKLILAGHGNQQEKIKKIISDNNLKNVKIYGFLQGRELKQLTRNTNAVFLSLKNQLNGLAVPSKFYSYLLMNKPIIAVVNKTSDIYRDINEFDLGTAVDEGDAKKLADSILKIKGLKKDVNTQRVYNQKYKKNIALDKYVVLINRLLNK